MLLSKTTDRRVGRYLAAAAAFLMALAAALPDGEPGAPRAVTQAAAGGLMAAALMLGFREGKAA